jgi:hypothetical protein
VTIKLNPDQADDAPVPTAEEGGDDSDPNDEEAEAPKPTEPAQEPTKTHQEASKPLESKQDTNHQHGCHNFQLVGDTLQCLNRKGQTVILVAPTKQHMSDMLGDVLHDGLAVYAKAKLFQSLKAPNGDKTIRQIAEVFGLTQADVRKHLCLLTLTAEEQQQVATCKLPVDEAYRILAMRQHERKPAGQNTEAKSEQKQAKKPVKKRRAAK